MRIDLTCPVGKEPLFHAVTLIPCAHKLNEEIARRIFGEIERTGSCREREPCPICKRIVDSYVPDHTICSLAHQYFDCPAPKVKIDGVPYPGVPGSFKTSYSEGELYQRIWKRKFESMTPTSSIKKFTLSKTEDGIFRFDPSVSELSQREKEIEFFKEFGIPFTNIDTKIRLIRVLKLLLKIHFFSEAASSDLRAIITMLNESD